MPEIDPQHLPQHLPQHVTVERDGRMIAEALVRTDVEHNVVSASLHVEPGHLPIGTRAELVDAFLDATDPAPGTHLEVALPAGEAEILDRMRERFTEVEIRAAGASVLLKGEIPPA